MKYFSGTSKIYSWKSDRMLEENIENITRSDGNFAPTFVDHYILPDINFNGHCLINNNISIPKKINKSIYFVHAKSMVKKLKDIFYIK